MRAAAIDIGTNSIKSVIGELGEDGRVHILSEELAIPRLGEGVHRSHVLSRKAQERTIAALRNFLDTAHTCSVERTRVVATSAVRDANNRDEFAGRIKSDLGADLDIISGEEECRLSYSAVAMDPELDSAANERAVVDSGGGSTEFTFGSGGRIIYSKSAKLGAVRLTEQALKNDPPGADELNQAKEIAEKVIREAVGEYRAESLIGVGGSVVNLARMITQTPPERTADIHASTLTSADLGRLIATLSKLTIDQRKSITGLDPERADIILGGAIIITEVLAVLQINRLIVSTRGLRHGVLYELLGLKS